MNHRSPSHNSRSQRVLWLLEGGSSGFEYTIETLPARSGDDARSESLRKVPSARKIPVEARGPDDRPNRGRSSNTSSIVTEGGASCRRWVRRNAALHVLGCTTRRGRRCRSCCSACSSRECEGSHAVLRASDVRRHRKKAMTSFVRATTPAAPRLSGERARKECMVRGRGVYGRRYSNELSHRSGGVARRIEREPVEAMEYLQRIHARPAYQRAVERGGPYELCVEMRAKERLSGRDPRA